VAPPFTLSRRRVLRSLGTAGLAALLTACVQSTPAAPTSAPSAATPSTSAPAPPTVASTASATPAGAATPTVQPAAAAPTIASVSTPKQVARNRTLILQSVDQPPGQFLDVQLMNPFQTGITRSGYQFAFEALYYYNPYYTDKVCGPPGVACQNGEMPWLATSYSYNKDYTQVLVKLRNGVEWSDGQPFTAKDVVFTINMLKEHAPKLIWSIDMKQWVKQVTAVDDHTVQIDLNNPNPRFFFSYFMFHEDVGIQIVPEHIWSGQDPTTFTNFDLGKGWPVVTGPWKLVQSNAQQKIWDRREDWWAAKTGFHPLPAPERIVFIPFEADPQVVPLVVGNNVDNAIPVQTLQNFQAMFGQNPKITTWSGTKPPYGYMDWFPWGIGFNDSKPPFDDPEIRWAINYALDRDQIVQIGYDGAGDKTLLPYPQFPALMKWLDLVESAGLYKKYPIGTHNPQKTADILQKKGYTKNNQGMWTKGGKTFSIVFNMGSNFLPIAPVVIAQLRKAGIDASFKISPNMATLLATGDLDGFFNGHGGSVRDPYYTLRLYQSQFSAPTGQPATYPYRWKNAQFDQLVDQMAMTSDDDPKLKDLFLQAIEIWMQNLPDIPLVLNYHRIPLNTTYWTNWPTAENPYINYANFHRTAPLWINEIKAVQ